MVSQHALEANGNRNVGGLVINRYLFVPESFGNISLGVL